MDNNPYNLFLNIKTLIKFHERDPISGVHNLMGCGRAQGTNYFVYTNQTNLLNKQGVAEITDTFPKVTAQ